MYNEQKWYLNSEIQEIFVANWIWKITCIFSYRPKSAAYLLLLIWRTYVSYILMIVILYLYTCIYYISNQIFTSIFINFFQKTKASIIWRNGSRPKDAEDGAHFHLLIQIIAFSYNYISWGLTMKRRGSLWRRS